MSISVNPNLIKDIRFYGAFDISACFNCGNCSAVCPLSDEKSSFPRKMIRLGQLGAKAELLSKQEMWLCYNCGECTQTCPRQAGPGEYMAALRRWAVARYEPTGLAAWMYKSQALGLAVTAILALLLGTFLLTSKPHHEFPDWIFKLVPYDSIHFLGMGIFGLLGLSMIVSLVRFGSNALKGQQDFWKRPLKEYFSAGKATVLEILTMNRQKPAANETHGWTSPWAVHLAIMGGFFGLLGATTSDFLFIYILGTKLYWPARILGTFSGLALLYGVSFAIWRRWKAEDAAVKHSQMSDWWLLIFLWILGVTGFWLEAAVGFHWTASVHSWVLLIHTVMAMELVLLAGMTKLAHVFYRPLALYLHFLPGGTGTTKPCGE